MSSREHFSWQAAVYSTELPPMVKLVLGVISARMNQLWLQGRVGRQTDVVLDSLSQTRFREPAAEILRRKREAVMGAEISMGDVA